MRKQNADVRLYLAFADGLSLAILLDWHYTFCMLAITLFGRPQIRLDDQELIISRRKSRALIYFLASQDQPVLRQQLLSIFWADLPRPAAQQTLRTTLHGLRRSLGDWIAAQEDWVGLSEQVWVDARQFERQLNETTDDIPALEQTLELYRGEFLEGFSLTAAQPFEDWLTVNREHYRRLAIRGWSALAGLYETQGDYQRALEKLERALAINRLQEDLQRDVIRLLYQSGDRPAAILRYDELRRLLDEEMGVPPMVETRALYDDILHDRLQPRALQPAGAMRRAPRRAPGQFVAVQESDVLPFIGRFLELRALQELTLLPGLVLIEGEAGVGKTRLVQQFLGQLDRIILIGRCRELEQSLPYYPLIEALRSLWSQPNWPDLSAQLLRQVPAIWLAEVARLLPELEETAVPLVSPRPADEARLWEGVRQFLNGIARLRPTTIFIDDLHWADAATLGLLGYLLRHTGGTPLRYLATMRPPALRSPLVPFIQMLVRENRLARLPLARLSNTEVLAIARALQVQNAEALADWLFKSSEGNAYILAELVRHARRVGLLSREGVFHADQLPAEPIVPQTVFSLIQSRLMRLSDAARRVLDAAVAQGREFEFKVVSQASGLSESAALDAIDELQAAGLILPQQDSWFQFDHPLTMEVAYQEVGDLRHRRMHRRVGEALEQLYVDRLEQIAGQLAWHFFEGEAPRRGARYAFLAGKQAERLAAWNEAVEFYGLAARGAAGAERLSALLALARAHFKAAHFPQASETLREALALAEASQADRSQTDHIRLELARTLLLQARYSEVIALAQQVCRSADPEVAIIAEMTWGTALSIEGADLQAASEHLEIAQSLWSDLPDAPLTLLAQIQFELGSVAAQQGDLELAVSYYRQSLVAASQIGDEALEQLALAHNNLAYHLHLLGDPAAVEYAEQGLALTELKGLLGVQPYLYSTLGEIALAAGELEKAEQYFNQGLALAERFSVRERIAGLNANLGRIAAARGQKSRAIHLLSTALGQADSLGVHHLAAQIRLWLAPLLPPEEGQRRLAEARSFAQSSGRKRLLQEIERLEK